MQSATHEPVRDVAAIEPTFAPLVPACARFGIGRCIAFKLAKEGMLDTFRLGQRTYVYIESLKSLPQRAGTREPKDLSKAHAASMRSAQRGRRAARR